METLVEYPSNYSLFRVADSKKLTTSELQEFNKKMVEIEEAGEPHTNLILSDGIYSFHIFNKVVSDKFEVQMSVEKLSDDEGNIPFSVVEEVPIFPGCESESDKRACFNEKIQKHISKNFNYPQAAQEAGIQGRVNVMFVIQEDGSIGHLKMRGPDKLLEDEVERIINRLPTMTPGKHKGTVVAVPFSIPVTFKLQ
jgi:TonB family protein